MTAIAYRHMTSTIQVLHNNSSIESIMLAYQSGGTVERQWAEYI